MTRFGYFLSGEEFSPAQLLEQATMAERAGFEALWISDHFHPWNRDQGNSPFVHDLRRVRGQQADGGPRTSEPDVSASGFLP